MTIFEKQSDGSVKKDKLVSEVIYNAENDQESSTTSLNYVEKLKLVTPILPSGIYKIEWSCEIKTDDGKKRQTDVRVQIDDKVTICECSTRPVPDDKAGGATIKSFWLCVGGFKIINSPAEGSHSIDIDYKRRDINGIAYIRRARVELNRHI